VNWSAYAKLGIARLWSLTKALLDDELGLEVASLAWLERALVS